MLSVIFCCEYRNKIVVALFSMLYDKQYIADGFWIIDHKYFIEKVQNGGGETKKLL